jgi:RND family efflux transporter MFP subunit
VTRHAVPFLAVSCLLAAACARSAPSAPPTGANDTPVAVTTARAATTDIPERFESGGVVRARLTATLASRVAGPVDTVAVSVGTRVRRGQTLLTLECRELDANASRERASSAAATETMQAADADVRGADSAQTLARATYDRVQGLFDKRSATAQERDQASAALQEAEAHAAAARARAAASRSAREAANAALHASETALSYATISSPFDGVVSERLVDPGTLASPGMPLLVVEDPAQLRLHVQVDEFRARTITPGQSAEAKLDQRDSWMPAQVTEMGRVDPASHSFLVKLDLVEAPELRPGEFGRARFTFGSRRAVTVPTASVVRRGQLAFVYIVTADGLARLRSVVAGEADGTRIEVLAGVSDGDIVVVGPPPALADGRRVSRQP